MWTNLYSPLFAKIFTQIFDSSIAEDYEARHVFMDLLVLADSDGCVDMTAGAIARRTNVPPEVVERALTQLSSPDPATRSPDEEGRRIVPIDNARAWGWRIVNYAHYRAIRDEETRREYHRTYKRAKRADAKAKKPKRRQSTTTDPIDPDNVLGDGIGGDDHLPTFTRHKAALTANGIVREED